MQLKHRVVVALFTAVALASGSAHAGSFTVTSTSLQTIASAVADPNDPAYSQVDENTTGNAFANAVKRVGFGETDVITAFGSALAFPFSDVQSISLQTVIEAATNHPEGKAGGESASAASRARLTFQVTSATTFELLASSDLQALAGTTGNASLLLEKIGGGTVYRSLFSVTGGAPESPKTLFLPSGAYALISEVGTHVGENGESHWTTNISLTAADGPIPVPLPAAVWPGLAMLASLAVARRYATNSARRV